MSSSAMSTVDDTYEFSRMALALGSDAVNSLKNSSILVVCSDSISGSALELIKCVVMAGVSKVKIFIYGDYQFTPHTNYYSYFDSDNTNNYSIENIIERQVARISELNNNVSVSYCYYDCGSGVSLDRSDYTTVVTCNCDYKTNCLEDKYARQYGAKFIAIGTYGLYGYVTCDFGTHTSKDVTGKPVTTGMIEQCYVTDVNDEVCCYKFITVDSHDMVGNVKVKFDQDQAEFTVECDGVNSFKMYCYKSYGKDLSLVKRFTEIKESKTFEQSSYADNIGTPSHTKIDDFSLFDRNTTILINHFNRLVIDTKVDKTYQNMLELFTKSVNNHQQLDNSIKINDTDINSIFYKLYHTYKGRFVGLDAIVGSIGAQEVMKSVANKYVPINTLYVNCLETLRNNYQEYRESNPEDFTLKGDIYDSYRMIYGDTVVTEMMNTSAFVVGSGAVGCEHLKNLAVLGVGLNKTNHITDDDSIELSNLNRQFLFRREHIGHEKSITATNQIKELLPFNMEAHTLRVPNDKFDDEFYGTVDVILNALDNNKARMHMDSQAIKYYKPLFECGTLGTGGSFQSVIPGLTEPFSAVQSSNVSKSIPVCTLKLFPTTYEHIVEHVRSLFEEYFSMASVVAKLEDINNNYNNIDMTLYDIKTMYESLVKLLDNSMDYESCVRYAHEIFHRIMIDPVYHLREKYPQDHMVDSKPYWSGAKIYPKLLTFDHTNKDHVDFIHRFANIWADQVGVNERFDDMSSYANVLADLEVPEPIDNTGLDKEEDDNKSNTIVEYFEKIKEIVSENRTKIDQMRVIEFEKDDSTNNHVEFVSIASNLRADIYSMPRKTDLEVKGIVGKIIPALATTTSIVSGFVMCELIKYVQGFDKIESYSYASFDIATNVYGIAQAFAPQTRNINDKDYTVWTRDSFDFEDEIMDVVDNFEDDDEYKVLNVMFGNDTYYSSLNSCDDEKCLGDILDKEYILTVELVKSEYTNINDVDKNKFKLYVDVKANNYSDDSNYSDFDSDEANSDDNHN